MRRKPTHARRAYRKPWLTRRQLAEFLTKNGYPISYQTLTRLCMTSDYQGPPTAGRWGKLCMHDEDLAMQWARNRFQRTGNC